MRNMTIEKLDNGRLTDAWPLLRIAGAHPNVDWWINEASSVIQRGGGILAARAASGAIHGIATYELTKRFARGSMLEIRTLFTLELSSRAPAKAMLRNSLYSLAAAMYCDGLVFPERGSISGRDA